jgi:hypothetical protein
MVFRKRINKENNQLKNLKKSGKSEVKRVKHRPQKKSTAEEPHWETSRRLESRRLKTILYSDPIHTQTSPYACALSRSLVVEDSNMQQHSVSHWPTSAQLFIVLSLSSLIHPGCNHTVPPCLHYFRSVELRIQNQQLDWISLSFLYVCRPVSVERLNVHIEICSNVLFIRREQQCHDNA